MPRQIMEPGQSNLIVSTLVHIYFVKCVAGVPCQSADTSPRKQIRVYVGRLRFEKKKRAKG
jgi:hypothetical protein